MLNAGEPLLRELHTTVVSCNVHRPETSTANNAKKKKSSSTPIDKLYEVVLHDTILFPEGGGQPTDTGVLKTASDGNYEVAEVKRRGGHAVHFVKAQEGEVRGLEVGAGVTARLDEAGYARRLDHVSCTLLMAFTFRILIQHTELCL